MIYDCNRPTEAEQGAAPDRLQLRSSFLLATLPAASELGRSAVARGSVGSVTIKNMRKSKPVILLAVVVAMLVAAFVVARPASKVLRINADSYPDQRFGNPAAVQKLSAVLKSHPNFDIYKVLWHVRSGVQVGRADTQQIVYDRRSRSLEYQLSPDDSDEWWGWTDVDEKEVRAVAQKSGYLKNLEDYGCGFIPYSGPVH